MFNIDFFGFNVFLLTISKITDNGRVIFYCNLVTSARWSSFDGFYDMMACVDCVVSKIITFIIIRIICKEFTLF